MKGRAEQSVHDGQPHKDGDGVFQAVDALSGAVNGLTSTAKTKRTRGIVQRGSALGGINRRGGGRSRKGRGKDQCATSSLTRMVGVVSDRRRRSQRRRAPHKLLKTKRARTRRGTVGMVSRRQTAPLRRRNDPEGGKGPEGGRRAVRGSGRDQ